jgi:putative hydrolase of the HAD superfamily
MLALSPPKAILFDLGDTVLHEVRFDPHAGIGRLLELSTDTPNASAADIHQAGEELYQEFRTGRSLGVELPCASLLQLFCDRFQIRTSLSPAELELEFWKPLCSMQPEPAIESVLLRASALRISTGVISNAMFSANVLRWELACHDLLRHFQFVMSSADYGLQKPHPAIFLAAAGRLGLKPDEIWFIGDSLESDVTGSRLAGMNSIWYNPKGKPCHSSPKPATVSSWEEFNYSLLMKLVE